MIFTEIIAHVLCSIQGCLIGGVTPNLRAVYVLIEKENEYKLIFYYHKDLSEEEEELVSLVDTEFIADFPSPNYKTQCSIHVLPYPEKITQGRYCVYKRYEGFNHNSFHSIEA
jgi:hypothetical protein